MSYDPQPTFEELAARTSASVAANDYGILRMSARRYAVVKRRVNLGSQVVGYDKVTPRTGGQLGAELEGPRRLRDWIEYDLVEGLDKMTHDGALRALYDLMHSTTGPE